MATPQSVPGPPITLTAPLRTWSPEQWIGAWQAKTDAQGGTVDTGFLISPTLTGGTVDGTTIGGVTPGAGTFSTLTAASGGTLGGTFAGTPTFSGAVTHGSTLAQQGAVTLGPGSTGGAAITQSGTGNFAIALGGTSNTLSFRNSAAALLLQLGGASAQVISAGQFVSQFQGGQSPVFSGNAVSAMAPWFQSLNWTGNCAVSGQPGVLGTYSFLNNAVVSTSGTGTVGTSLNMTMGAASVGTAHLLTLTVNVPVTTTNTGATIWSLLNGTVTASAAQGGTGTTVSTAKGSILGLNPNVQLQSGAVNFAGISTVEFDLSVAAGATVMDKIGWQLVLTSPDAVQGARDDVAISLNNQWIQTSGANSGGWQVGFGIGRQGGYFPISSTGTIIKTIGNVSGDSQTAAIGIDFSSATFSTAFLKSTGFTVDGSGNTTGLTYKVGVNQVVGARVTGWSAASNGSRAALNGSSATLAQTSAALAQLIEDITTHGLIGT